MASAGDTWYVALLGMADSYLKAANVKEAVRCLSAVFNFSPPPMICARTHLQIGNILHTRKREVLFVDRSSTEKVEMSPAELEAGVEREDQAH